MDLVNDQNPIMSFRPGMLCERDYYLLQDFINVTHLYTDDYPGTGHSRIPYLFRLSIPFLTPPDNVVVEGNTVRVEWSGKEFKIDQAIYDPMGREFLPGCTYSIPPSSVTIHLLCCGLDQVHVEGVYGNKSFSYLMYKPPYFPVLIMHVSNVVHRGDPGYECEMSTKNTLDNSDKYSLHDLLMLIYHWRVTSATASIDPLSVFTQAIAEPGLAHMSFTLSCSKCLPSPPFSGEMTSDAYLEMVSRVDGWVCNIPIDQLLVGYTVLSLLDYFLPFMGFKAAIQPFSNYWVVISTVTPDSDPNTPPDFYLIHGDLIVLGRCGSEPWPCFSYIHYDSDFIPSSDCLSRPVKVFTKTYPVEHRDHPNCGDYYRVEYWTENFKPQGEAEDNDVYAVLPEGATKMAGYSFVMFQGWNDGTGYGGCQPPVYSSKLYGSTVLYDIDDVTYFVDFSYGPYDPVPRVSSISDVLAMAKTKMNESRNIDQWFGGYSYMIGRVG